MQSAAERVAAGGEGVCATGRGYSGGGIPSPRCARVGTGGGAPGVGCAGGGQDRCYSAGHAGAPPPPPRSLPPY